MFGELLVRYFRFWVYFLFFLSLLEILLHPAYQSGWAWSCWGSKTTSKSQWLKTVEVYFILRLHICHVQHGLHDVYCERPYHLEQGLANFFCKGPDGKYVRLLETTQSLLQLLSFAIVVHKQPWTGRKGMGTTMFQ